MSHKFERKKMYLEVDDVEKIVELEDNKDTYNPYLFRCLKSPVSKYRLHIGLNDLWLDWPSGHDLKLVSMDYGVVPTKVIFNFPATIVFWRDGTKTVVKCGDDDVWDPEKAITMCIAKKVLGNTGNYNNKIRKMLEMGGNQESSKTLDNQESSKMLKETLRRLKEEANKATTNLRTSLLAAEIGVPMTPLKDQ